MAKKPPKGSKTDKVKIKDDMDLSEFGDLDDLGGEMSFGDEGDIDADNRTPSRAKVVKDLGKQAASGALDSIIKNAAKKSLPDEYSANYTDAMDIASFASEVVDKNKQALQKSTYKLGKEVKKILPFKVGLLDKYLEAQQSNFESARQQSEEEVRQAGIGSETAAIFDKQLEVQKSLYARTEAQGEVDRNASLVQGKLAQDVLANMDGNIAHQTAFITQISKEYYKRSLELQYKSFYVQADSLKTMREYYKAFSLQFTNIEKNTSLPDFVKLKRTEKIQDILREQSIQSIYGSLTDNNKYLQSVKKKISGMVDAKVQEVTTAMDGAASMLDMVNSSSEGTGSSAVGMLGGMGAAMGGSVLGEKIAKLIPQKFLEKIKGNKTVQKGGNLLGTLAASPSSALEAAKEATARKVEENEDESTLGRKMTKKMFSGLNTFLGLATPGAESHEVKNDGYLSHVEPAIFDKNVHRSITEVIPMYLSKILQTNSELTQMYGFTNKGKLRGFVDKPGELVYDFEQRKLGSQQELNDNFKAKIFSETSIAPKSKTAANNILSQTYIDASKKEGASKGDLTKLKKTLDKKDNKDKLAKYIELATPAGGQTPDLETLLNYKNDERLNKLVTNKEELKGLDKLLETMQANEIVDKKAINSRMKDITRLFPTAVIIETALKASQLCSAEPHVISEEAAEVLSRAFVSYIQETANDVTPRSVITADVFFSKNGGTRLIYPTPEIGKQVDDAIRVLRDNLNKIVSLSVGDTMDISGTAITKQFAFMNKALREGKDVEPNVFKLANKLNPNLVKTGMPNVDNYRGGSLEIAQPGGNVPREHIIDLIARNPLEVRLARDRSTEANVVDRATGGASKRINDLKDKLVANKNNPFKMAEIMIQEVKGAVSAASSKLADEARSLGKTISDLGELAVNQASEAALDGLVNKYATAITQMEKYIENFKKTLLEMDQDIASTQSVVEGTMQEGSNQSAKITRGAQASRAGVEASLRLMNEVLVNMKQNEASIKALKERSVSGDKTIVFSAIKSTMIASMDKMKNALAEYETAGKKLTI